ncbi:aromatic acid exporter family protein [Streptomyces sp. NPDC057137]|uniref:aromatic acid exporter family protein n=1 Tax=Streptomyces sp. NPDC057137 TaxID=3346030 RepID=UPI0036430421
MTGGAVAAKKTFRYDGDGDGDDHDAVPDRGDAHISGGCSGKASGSESGSAARTFRRALEPVRSWGMGLFRHCVRGITSSGPERDDLLLQGKGVTAAVVAWSLANWLLPSTVTTFAPFTALLILQVTIYQSLRDCIQYLTAMLLGAALAAGLGATAGVHAWSLAVLILCALAIGKTQRLGYQGTQVSVIGIFAFSAGHGSLSYIGHLVASVAIGAACAITAHLVLAPVRRTSRSRRAVEQLSTEAQQVLTLLSVATAGEEPLSEKDCKEWVRQCIRISAEVDRVRAVIDDERENSRLNPRPAHPGAHRLLTRTHPTITIVDRSLWHIQSIVRSLSYAAGGDCDVLPREFLLPYSDLLSRTARIIQQIVQQRDDTAGLTASLSDAWSRYRELETGSHHTPDGPPAQTALRGSLITDVGRLLNELHQALPEAPVSPNSLAAP